MCGEASTRWYGCICKVQDLARPNSRLSLCPVTPLTRSVTRRLTHPLTHPPTHSLTHSLTHSFTHAPTHSLTHSPTQQSPPLLSQVRHMTSLKDLSVPHHVLGLSNYDEFGILPHEWVHTNKLQSAARAASQALEVRPEYPKGTAHVSCM